MNVLIINSNRHMQPMTVMPVGACIVAEAAERAGHAVRLLDLAFSKNPSRATEEELEHHPPDLVGISVRNIDNNELHSPIEFPKEVAALTEIIRRKRAVPVVLGGAAVGLMPEALLRVTGAHWAVLNDGEAVFPKLLDALAHGRDPKGIPGVAWLEGGSFGRSPADGHVAMDECLVPDFARWLHLKRYLSAMAVVPVQTQRGCAEKCVYCTYRFADGPGHRMAPPASVAEAVRKLASSGIRDIEFVDSVFNSPYGHAMEICERLAAARLGVRLHTMEMNPRPLDDALFGTMERAGFASAAITAESAADAALEGLGKGYDAATVRRVADIVARHRIPCMWVFLLGGPGETEATVRETLHFAQTAIRPSDVAFFSVGIRIYPGAGIEAIARKQGILTVPPEEMLEPVFYFSPDLDPQWLQEEVHRAVAAHPNLLGPTALHVPFVTTLHRIAYRLGVRPPLWRFTRHARRLLRWTGRDLS